MSGHIEQIICPSCEKECSAEVHHTHPFWSYVHHCECGYIITESEWQKAEVLEQ